MPLFSIVIPTRRRAERLRHALNTVLDQSFVDFEVIVQDNASGPDVRAVIEACGDDRVRHHRSDVDLAMQHNWEAALSSVRGEYVLYLGDDDGLLPDCLHRVAQSVAATNADIVNLNSGYYGWPCSPDVARRDYLMAMIKMGRDDAPYVEADAAAELRQNFADFSTGALSAMIYVSFVRRQVIDTVRKRFGAYFDHPVPDVWSALANLWASKRFICLSSAGHIAGSSSSSTGGGLQFGGDRNKSQESVRLNRFDTWSKDLPYLEGNFSALMYSVFHQAKNTFFYDQQDIALSHESAIHHAYATAWSSGDPEAVEKAVAWGRRLGAAFGFTPPPPPEGAPPPPISPVSHAKVDSLGPDGFVISQSLGGMMYIMLDARRGGVSDIHGACRYAAIAIAAALTDDDQSKSQAKTIKGHIR